MTREDALTLVDRHVRILHGGPDYVQHHDPEGVVVDVTDTQLFMKDRSISRTSRAGGTWHRYEGPQHQQDEPRGWHLASIAKVHLLDVPLD